MAPQAFVAEVVLEAWNSASPFLALVLAAVPLQLPFFLMRIVFQELSAYSVTCSNLAWLSIEKHLKLGAFALVSRSLC